MEEWLMPIFIFNMISVVVAFGISYLLFGSRFNHVYWLVPFLGSLHSLAVILICYGHEYIHIPLSLELMLIVEIIIWILPFWAIDMIILKHLPMFHLPGKQYPLMESLLISVLSIIGLMVGLGRYVMSNFGGLP